MRGGRTRISAWVSAAGLAVLCAPSARGLDPPPALGLEPPDARALFQTYCAACHGESGDGRGTTPLDRPARSFQDGGFSFGNTREALTRTITYGIPGTPMPGFELALTEAERLALAEHVIALGPAVEPESAEGATLVVRDRPLVVRGLLPPLVEGAPPWPRGIVLGTTSGLSFEYRADDVRLLGVRQGGFVERTDWVGRGGTALAPLGRLVHACDRADPPPAFALAVPGEPSRPLAARLEGTLVNGAEAIVRYRLVDGADPADRLHPGGRVVARVEETPSAATSSAGAGWRRRFAVAAAERAIALELRVLARTGATEDVASLSTPGARGPVRWTVVRHADGLYECAGIDEVLAVETEQGVFARLALAPGERRDLALTTLLLSSWSDTARAALAETSLR